MPPVNYRHLREFVQTLEEAGELIRIGEPCSPFLEIAALTELASKSPGGGKALFFENVSGSSFPVLTNAFGSRRRINLAFGTEDLNEVSNRLKQIVHLSPPQGWKEKLTLAWKALGWSRFLPRKIRGAAPCQEVVYRGDEVDLTRLPVLTTWPLDGGPFVTLPLVITKSLLTGARNVGMYRLQVFDRNSTGMHWHIHKDGAHFFQEYRKAGRRMEVAVAIGADPAVTYAATAPLPRGIDELLLAGFIRQAPVPLVKALTVDLDVPAEAEFILEGYVDPEERKIEGPFGDHTGYYSLPDLYPVFHVTAVTHRRNPIYPATVVGRPPMEDCWLALATERLFLPLLRMVHPEIVDYWLPWEGVFHNLVVVAVDKTYPGQARKVMQSLWGAGQMSFCKTIIVVDGDFPLTYDSLRLRMQEELDFNRDLEFSRGILDVLDHAAPWPLFGGKLGIDLTTPITGEPPRQPAGQGGKPPFSFAPPYFPGRESRLVGEKSRHPLLLIRVEKVRHPALPSLADGFITHYPPGTIAIFFDNDEDLEDGARLLWRLLNNYDPSRDIVMKEGRLMIDATRKGPAEGFSRPWPEDAVMSAEVERKAREKAKKWGII